MQSHFNVLEANESISEHKILISFRKLVGLYMKHKNKILSHFQLHDCKSTGNKTKQHKEESYDYEGKKKGPEKNCKWDTKCTEYWT